MTATIDAAQAVSAPEPARQRRQLPPGTALVAWVVGALGVLAVWALVYLVVLGSLQEQSSQKRLYAKYRSELSQATAPLGPTAYDRPVALLTVPAAGLRNAVVVEGTEGQDLEKGPGHLRDTVLPGQAGTAVLLGRSVTFGAPFGRLTDLKPGDTITTTTGQGTFTYVVERTRRPGDPLPPTLADGRSRLVLGTSTGSGWRAGFAPTSVVYVDALLKGKAQPSDGTAASVAVPASEQPMGTTTSPLIRLVLWLQALLLVALGTAWLSARWGSRKTWAVAVPVLTGVAIGASSVAAELLPNLL